MKKTVLILSIIFAGIASCTYKKEPIYIKTSTTSQNDSCTTNISYSKHIIPIMTAYCYSCHDPSGGQKVLSSYAGLKDGVDNGHLKERINSTDPLNYPTMPPSGSLTSCELAKFNAWLTAGAPNN